jgi:formylglycine-generating enzyme required for sulfatase activity
LDQGSIGKEIQVKLPGQVIMKFSFCPSGSFTMGSPATEADSIEDAAQVQVHISKGFWMGQTEVTQAQWKAVMSDNPSKFNGDELPVETVSWEEVQTYINKVNQLVPLSEGWGYALPTEAQWEYACRAGTSTPFAFGLSLASTEANFNGNYPHGTMLKGIYLGTTCAVGSYIANTWGLYDMHGNVYEWCADLYAERLDGGPDPPGASLGSYRVGRGGAWDDLGINCRSAIRLKSAPAYRADNLGFRLAAVKVR